MHYISQVSDPTTDLLLSDLNNAALSALNELKQEKSTKLFCLGKQKVLSIILRTLQA